MSASPGQLTAGDTRGLAASLAPALQRACDGRLDEITWFKADWQRGGAATGTSRFALPDGSSVDVVVKFPVVQRELRWVRCLQDESDNELVVPRLYASGDSLNGYDFAWIVIERFAFGPLGLKWDAGHISRIADAIARFSRSAARQNVDESPRYENWDALLATALSNLKVNEIEPRKRWSTAVKTLAGRLDQLVAEWRARPVDEWIHGDLHMANAMSRHGMTDGPASLIDLAEVRCGHWLEDAVYLERQLWSRPTRLKTCKPVREIAQARKQHGMPVDEEYPRLAMIRRALLAATAPSFLKSEGDPKHLEASLNWLEAALVELK